MSAPVHHGGTPRARAAGASGARAIGAGAACASGTPGEPPFGPPFDVRETWSQDQLAAHRLERLREQLATVGRDSAHYRAQWDAIGFDPSGLASLDDLARLPVTTKGDYRRALDAAPPLGTMLAVPRRRVARVHFSSGTTAVPTPVAWTADDLLRWGDLYARMAWSQGVRPGDVYQCLFSYAWFVGGLGATAGYTALGATVIPAGSADTERQVDTLFRFGTTCVGGTPSFLLHLAEAAERLGRPLADSAVRSVMVGGEPGGAVDGTRAAIERAWGAKCFDGYGCLEFQPVAWECEAQAGGHLAEDFVRAELLDPRTREPVPDGQPGVLVLTHLDRQACPLVRWWTGDVVKLDRSPCACGRTHARMPGGVRGRADDMLVIRGVNVFPSAVEDVVRRLPGTGGEFRIVVGSEPAGAGGYDRGVRVLVEAAPGTDPGGELGERLADALHRELKVRADVEVVAAGRLPRSTHKTQRVVRADDAGKDTIHVG